MGRTYAGVLGCLAFATVLAHGAIHAAGLEATVARAAAWMIPFAAAGWLVGRVAQMTVEESVRVRMADQLATRAAQAQDAPPPSAAKA